METNLRNRKSSKRLAKELDDNKPIENIGDIDNEKDSRNERLQRPEATTDDELALQKENDSKHQIEQSNSVIVEASLVNLLESGKVSLTFDLIPLLIFVITFCTRIYKLWTPNNIVFDELHYGKYISLYMKNVFFFDQHPPLGKQLIAGIAQLSGFDGNFTFSRIGAEYSNNVPVFMLRLLPALCGSLLPCCVYKLLLETKLHKLTATFGALLIVFDNSLLAQSRFVLMEPLLLLFSTMGILFLLKSCACKMISLERWIYAILAAACLTCGLSVKYVGVYTLFLGFLIMARHCWTYLADKTISSIVYTIAIILKGVIFTTIPVALYLAIFYVHLTVLHRAGPHDTIMTSAFQASLEGGLASITKGQPFNVVHGSQITLRHTHGRTCWLHSHTHVYPLRYPDNRGSSHQQQVTCYSFKDVNNWWIVKRPSKSSLVVTDDQDVIKHGDEIQLVHGITSRALNSHDVAAAVSPQSQEISCYIDYNVSMPAQILWRVDVINRDQAGDVWHAITSQVRLIHVTTGQALKFSGRQLPDWGFNQHEVVADRVIAQQDTVWNVEEHRYTTASDQKERERQLISHEMIPTAPTTLTFWNKFLELQTKMMWHTDKVQPHMYSSTPLEWPLMNKGIAYWVDKTSNAQIYLIGNILLWYSATIGLVVYAAFTVFYMLRRRRLIHDLDPVEWDKFFNNGEVYFVGYLIHYLPYFFLERTMFLHNYFPALIFKILLLCFVLEHIFYVLKCKVKSGALVAGYKVLLLLWFAGIVYVYQKFSVLSYGTTKLSSDDVLNLRWKNTWDFILHKDLA